MRPFHPDSNFCCCRKRENSRIILVFLGRNFKNQIKQASRVCEHPRTLRHMTVSSELGLCLYPLFHGPGQGGTQKNLGQRLRNKVWLSSILF